MQPCSSLLSSVPRGKWLPLIARGAFDTLLSSVGEPRYPLQGEDVKERYNHIGIQLYSRFTQLHWGQDTDLHQLTIQCLSYFVVAPPEIPTVITLAALVPITGEAILFGLLCFVFFSAAPIWTESITRSHINHFLNLAWDNAAKRRVEGEIQAGRSY